MKLKTIVQALTAVSVGSALLLAGIAHAAPAAAQGQFEVAKHYALSGADGWDYVGYDAVRHHLFISRGNHVQVVDVNSGQLVGEIANTDGVHGFAFVQDPQRAFITNGPTHTLMLVNIDTLRTLEPSEAGGPRPDGIT